MENENQREIESSSPGHSESTTSIIDAIHSIAKYYAYSEVNTEEKLILFLKSWWSKTYNRPLKDPLLLSYSLEELIFEFFNQSEREQATEFKAKGQSDKIEKDKENEALDWAEQEEIREQEELKKKEEEAKLKAETVKENPNSEEYEPTEEELAWMEAQLEEVRKKQGLSDFGENINDDFK